ncbi:uncharacterized protein LOC134249459, partial [Saccostrea cucullata]|uniref:uncharacterized protein LOC134249459 n=1 Tax=Saccostrea cuccullata TaxID=36930 RepID=UPI002ED64F9B
RERGNNTETKHDKVTKQDIATESDTDSKHDDQTEPNNEAKHDKQMEHDKEPKHDEQREVETESNHDKESHTDEEQKHDEQIVRDIEPKHDEQKEIDKEQKHYEQTERDKESKHDEQTEANTESNHDKTENDKEQKHYKQAEDDTDPKETECETKSFITLLEEELEERKLKLRFGNKDDVVLDVLDFAGQGEYYASHQTYIRKDAIFILLVDTSKDVNKRTEQQERKGNLSIQKTVDKKIFLCDRPGVAFHCWSPKDYFYYWLKTIQIHGGMSERIIFVGTHEDKKRDDFDFGHLLNDAITENLITEKYSKPIITNLCRYDEVTEDALSKIKNEICIHIKKCTRENQPAKWVKFASRFDMIKRKFHMGTIEDVLQMIDHFDPEMSDTEVADMLHFFHSSGKIIFFNIDRLQDIVILDIPWFINCFKHIIADRKHVEEDCSIVDVKDQKMLRIFHEKGILEICLYRKLLTQKSISEQYQNTLGEYQSKLGMMFYIQNYKINDGSSIDGGYIPSINTQEFKPIIERYGSDESSQILCIKFKDYLPYDFFGRLVVACVNSGHWHPYDYRLCKNGADMCYRDSNNDSKQIYLFTSRKIVTAQFIGKHSKKHGLEVKQEILNIVRQLVQFYARSNEYEIGFLCRKKEGYMEDSVNHFVSKRYKYCQGCHGTCDWVDTESFWKEESNTENTISTRKLVPSQIAYKVYSHFVTRVSEIAATTTILQGISSNLDWAWIDDLAFIGRELNDLHRKSDADAEKKDTALRNISKVLKKISCGLDKKTGFKDFRKEIFFLWTQTTGLFEEIQGIPVVSLKQKEKHGTEISLEAETDVPIRHHLWLKKIQSNRQYKVLRPSDEEGEKYKFQEYKDKLLMTIKNFDVQDNGHYFVLVVTETGASVCRETIQPFAGKIEIVSTIYLILKLFN